MRTFLIRAAQLLAAAAVGAGVVAASTTDAPPLELLSDTDIGFAQDMSGHHQQAVTMSDMLAADAGPDVHALAEGIRFQQLNEIGQMTGWLQLAGAPPAATHPMAWMHADSDHHHSGPAAMPGLASPADLAALQRSTGRTNEVLFLQYMTRHHQGGIEMAAYAGRHTTNDAVRRAVMLMVDEQTQELQLMSTMLSQRSAAALPFP
jgi:uncharacterized protein (DUF305 family)